MFDEVTSLTERDDDVLLTRGFENAVAVARVGYQRSALGNWCNDMITDGCSEGLKLLALAPDTLNGVLRTSFNLTALRAQRANCIWGDAFRRPFQYQEICGFRPSPVLHHAAERVGSAATPDAHNSEGSASVRVGLL